MKRVIWVIIIISNTVWGQKIDYNKVILPRNSGSISLEERLVQLAWQNNPASEIAQKNIGVSEYRVNIAKWDWLSRIVVSGNINEFTIDQENERAEFFPRYNFALNVPLGVFAKQPMETRMVRQQLYIEQEKLNQLKLEIRAEVLKRYENYKRDMKIADLLGEVLSETKTVYDNVKGQINTGQLVVGENYDISERFKRAQIDKIKADAQVKISKLSLEEMIGIKYEEVIN
ncbi:MAG: TolC family protein [Bacteroidota bacterium]